LVRANNVAFALRNRQAELAVEEKVVGTGTLSNRPQIAVVRPLSSQ
jgi:hypothetical protein